MLDVLYDIERGDAGLVLLDGFLRHEVRIQQSFPCELRAGLDSIAVSRYEEQTQLSRLP